MAKRSPPLLVGRNAVSRASRSLPSVRKRHVRRLVVGSYAHALRRSGMTNVIVTRRRIMIATPTFSPDGLPGRNGSSSRWTRVDGSAARA